MAYPRVPVLPPDWTALLRKALRAVLMAEAVAVRELRKALQVATVDARAQLLTNDYDEALAIPALMEADNRLYAALVALVLLLRKNVRGDAEAQFRAEAELGGLDLTVVFGTVSETTDEDQARAESVARSFAAAWLLAAIVAYRKRLRDPIGAVNASLDYRLRRIGGTEIPQAYARAHEDWVRFVFADLGPTLRAQWAKRWDATLDWKTCKVCRKMHGEVVPVLAAFTDFLVPGDVHPYCRCVPTIIPTPIVRSLAA